MARPVKQYRPSPLQKIPETLVKDRNTICPFNPLIFSFFTRSVPFCSKGYVFMDSFCKSVSTRFQQVIYTFFINMVSFATDSSDRKPAPLPDGDFSTALL